jgi:hypothetical protein
MLLQHIHRIPGLEHTSTAVVVEMHLSADIPYYALPAAEFVTAHSHPPPPFIVVSVTSDALALLLEQAVPDAVCYSEDDAQHRVMTTMSSLLQVCVIAAAGHHLMDRAERGLQPPCAFHVDMEEIDNDLKKNCLNATLYAFRGAAAQWPLSKAFPRYIVRLLQEIHFFADIIESELLRYPRVQGGSDSGAAGISQTIPTALRTF